MSIEPAPDAPLRRLDRRDFLKASACGLAAGSIGLRARLAVAAQQGGGHPLAPKPTHFPPRAKRLLLVYLTGGFSHIDTFDPKPLLTRDHGKVMSAPGLRDIGQQPLLQSPFQFSRCGRSGLLISELFPRLQAVADDLCVIRTMHTDIVEHFQATLAMHTGSATVPMPSLGSWISHGLGTSNLNLPGYVVLAEFFPYAGAQVWDAGFLPPIHQGVRLVPGDRPIADLSPIARPVTLRQLEEILLRDFNESHAGIRPDDLNLRARTQSIETARGMMREAPEIFDLAREPAATLEDYGVARGDNRSFGWQCLMARRLLERGVRTVELIDSGSSGNWDAHSNMEEHRPKALRVDRAIAALIRDLKHRGLFEDTLLMIATEFGRTPWSQDAASKGRNHWAKAFTCLLAGGGVQGGTTYGETDDYGAQIAADPVHVHDYHATILHILGLDHTRLTYRYAGRDFRLTDVSGTVIGKILA